ncbi:MAG: tyrosine--tRNA ligase [Longimicrobiales bacterium]|nr:tyrosine--tRNA ligase [Longimicrobiales bacterium]
MSVLEEFRWRGMIQDITEGAEEAFAGDPVTAYIGFDPTARSLHVGTLLPIMGLVHLQRHGHRPIAVVGGGTGLIGDPSGKSQERVLLTRDEVAHNLEGIREQLERFLDFDAEENPARILNNLEWLGELSFVDFLRDVGKHFSVNVLLRKESIRRRLEDEESGISYTEFSYVLLQAYDFYELYQRHGCTVQLGGSDQWGNIVAGADLIRRVAGGKAHGVVFPLLTTSAGTKFGKTEEGTIWLDPERTSPFRFYQFWINTDDADVVRYLKFFTLLDREEIAELEQAVEEEPWKREAQRRLAEDVTRRVHGEDGLRRAEEATRVLFGGEDLEGFGAEEIADIFADVPSTEIDAGELAGDGKDLLDLLAEAGVTSSKGEARRSIDQGGIYLNNRRVEEQGRTVSLDDAVEGRFLVLRKGKKRYHLVKVTDR